MTPRSGAAFLAALKRGINAPQRRTRVWRQQAGPWHQCGEHEAIEWDD